MKRSSFFLLAAWLCIPLRLTAAVPVPAPDSLLANDTLAVLTVPDYAKARSVWGQWPSTRLWNDPAIKPFRDKLMGKFKSEFVDPVEKQMGIKFSDYADLAQGQVTLAVTQNEWDGKSDKLPGFLLLVDSRDKSEVLKTNLATLRKKWVDSGKQVRSDKIRDVEFTTLVFSTDEFSKTIDKALPKTKEKDKDKENTEPAEEKPKDAPKKIELLVGQSGSLLIIGNSAKDAEKILIRQGGGAVPSLAEQASFAAHSKMFRDSSSYGWINLKPVIEALSKSFKGAAAAAPGLSLDKIISALGFNALQTLAISTSDNTEGMVMQMQLNVPEANRKGLFKVLAFDAKDASPLPFVPADAIKFSRWRMDMQKGWNTIESTLGEINPQFAGGIKMMVDLAGKDKDPNFDLRKSLIANLGDDIISYQKVPRSQSFEDLNSPPTLFLIGSPKAEQLAASIRAISAFMPQAAKVKEREFLGRKVYSLTLPSEGEPGKKRDRVLSYTASGGYVVFSTDVATFEEYLRGNTPSSLRDTPGLASAAQKIGGMETGLFGYENQAETMRATFETLKKESGLLAKMFAAQLGQNPEANDKDSKFKEWFDFALLPSFDRISKYFYITVWGGNVTSEGFNIKMFSPTPPQLKK